MTDFQKDLKKHNLTEQDFLDHLMEITQFIDSVISFDPDRDKIILDYTKNETGTNELVEKYGFEQLIYLCELVLRKIYGAEFNNVQRISC